MNAAMEEAKAVRAKPRRAAAAPGGDALVAEGRRIPVTNLGKVLYPEAGFTKGQLINYYIRIASVLLPHLKDRPLTLKRYPNGVDHPFFYQKRSPPERPEWVATAQVWSEQNGESMEYCLANDLPTLVWLGNLADLEFHTFLARQPNVDCPTMVMFDLDPGPPASVLECAQVALWLRRVLEKIGLQSFAKTSGSKGMQICVPLNTPVTYDATSAFARTLAESFERENPALALARMRRDLRPGKVFIDWSQNSRHKTTVSVYSPRAMPLPAVSTPLAWSEVEAAWKKKDGRKLSFLVDDVLKRVDRDGDLFAPVLKLKQKLPQL